MKKYLNKGLREFLNTKEILISASIALLQININIKIVPIVNLFPIQFKVVKLKNSLKELKVKKATLLMIAMNQQPQVSQA